MAERSAVVQTRLILVGVAVMLSLGMGLRQSLGLFMPPVTHDLGITVSQFTLALFVQNLTWGVSQAAVGALVLAVAVSVLHGRILLDTRSARLTQRNVGSRISLALAGVIHQVRRKKCREKRSWSATKQMSSWQADRWWTAMGRAAFVMASV